MTNEPKPEHPVLADGAMIAAWYHEQLLLRAAERGSPMDANDFLVGIGALVDAADQFRLLAYPNGERAGFQTLRSFLKGMVSHIDRRTKPLSTRR